jgi:hypothetical protein
LEVVDDSKLSFLEEIFTTWPKTNQKFELKQVKSMFLTTVAKRILEKIAKILKPQFLLKKTNRLPLWPHHKLNFYF